jgi:hypothetical protein
VCKLFDAKGLRQESFHLAQLISRNHQIYVKTDDRLCVRIDCLPSDDAIANRVLTKQANQLLD